MNQRTRQILKSHFQKYPKLEIEDVFKFLHQSVFGCEHAVISEEIAIERIRCECEQHGEGLQSLNEPLDGAYSRIHLGWVNEGLSPETLGKLFFLSAKAEQKGVEVLEEKLKIAMEMTKEKILPFDQEQFALKWNKWKSDGYSALHHSQRFREEYKPAYRVIFGDYIPFLPLFRELDKMLSGEKQIVVAIDGGSASGKSTLGELLEMIYDCTVFHMDDFFLRPEQRTKNRLEEPGGNVDRERFLAEVLVPLSKNMAVLYAPFDCGTQKIMPPETVVPKRLTVVEGAYSMHPELAAFYDYSVFLEINGELQKKRIEKRNSPQFAKRFFEEWIPIENNYFQKTETKKRCDLVVEIPR